MTDPVSSGVHRYLLASAEAIQPPARMRLATELQPVSGADYLILSPSLFMPALTDLITLRQGQGLMVAVENLQVIYDAFDGRPTSDAIHTYLQNAYTTWNPRPAYVLLVGDGTFDPKLYRADSKETFLPPYLADVDPWMGETAANNRYALLDGGAQGGGDILPDLLVGRLPVNTIMETQIVVDKIVRYETDPYPGGWNSNVVFAADHDRYGHASGHPHALERGRGADLVQWPHVGAPVGRRAPFSPRRCRRSAQRQPIARRPGNDLFHRAVSRAGRHASGRNPAPRGGGRCGCRLGGDGFGRRHRPPAISTRFPGLGLSTP